MSDADDYRSLLVRFRKKQLTVSMSNLRRMEQVFDDAAKSLIQKMASAQAGSLREAVTGSLLQGVEKILVNLRSQFADALTIGMADVAQVAADRELATEQLLGKPADDRLVPDQRTFFESPEGSVSVEFGRVASSAVDAAASKVWGDGLKLSDRLYKLDQGLRETIHDTIVQGVAEQMSATELASRLEVTLTAAGADNARYKAMRIARTEINSAHREAHIQSAIDPATGQLKDWIEAIGWRLSASHPRADICDVWASDDSGLGPGNYLPEDVPQDHPHGLCYTVSVLKDYPGVSAPTVKARPELVSAAEARYNAEKYADPAATRWIDQYGN